MKKNAAHPEFAFELPTVVVPAIRVPQADGSILFRAGKPEVVEPVISTAEAAKILQLSQRHIEHQCAVGLFKTAYKPGGQPRSKWLIARAEVLARKNAPA